jgi:SNF2 family DNA or RNA helicase
VIGPNGEVIRPRIIEDLAVNPKLDWCVEQIKKHPLNEKILFWSWMTHDIDGLSARLTADGIKHVVFKGTTSDEARIEAERQFNKDPECRVFIGNAGAGGSGLNLLGHDPKAPELYDTDATMSVYIAQNWNAVHRSQSEDRNHRRGTRKPVMVVTLACESTIDEDIHERVTSKRQSALEISDIRSLLSKIMGDLS